MKITIKYTSGHQYGWSYLASAEVNGEEHHGFGSTIEIARGHLLERVKKAINQPEMPPDEEVEIPDRCWQPVGPF